MSNFILPIQLADKTNFQDAVVEAKNLAAKLGILYVSFGFNRVNVMVSPECTSDEREKGYVRYMKYSHDFNTTVIIGGPLARKDGN